MKSLAVVFLFILGATSKPCSTLQRSNNHFIHVNSTVLYDDPDEYYSHEFPHDCNMHYINPLRLAPAGSKKNIWITYLGDSINRHLFYELAPGFSNWKPTHDEDLSEELDRTFPLLGAHEGPPNDMVLGGKLATFHNHKIVCCNNVYRAEDDDGEHCTYGMESRADQEGFDKRQARIYNSYLFENIAEFVDEKIAPKYHQHGFVCVSMIWAPTFSEAHEQMEKIWNGEHKHTPDGIVMNMGLHQFNIEEKDVDIFMNYTNKLHKEYRPTILYHSPTAIDEHNEDYHSSATPSIMKHLIASVYEWRVQPGLWPAISEYLDFYDFSGQEHAAGCSLDGIHFPALCVHNSLVTQWDLNFFEHFGLIRQR